MADAGSSFAASSGAVGPHPVALVAALASSGWDAERLRAHRAERQGAELPWPHPEAAERVAALGAGQFHAVLGEVRRLTGLTGLRATRRQGPRVIGAAEQRLLADRPPHHGNV
ncbi:hypothetical protein ACSDQ9_09630 [Aestuariimicrobium soli]|uniref:hypothetical protein n=1 Tax=Aestuariimicrobium soli TaxID=2035834 RepID=UPI003EBBDD23